MRNGQAMSGQGVHAFVENFRTASEGPEKIKQDLQSLKTTYEGEMPRHPAVVEKIDACISVASTLEGMMAELHGVGRQAHAGDFERTDNPRGGSHGREGRADVQQAQRDGAI